MSTDSGPGQREVAHRLFAAEFEDSELEYADSEEERAPKYVVTPTGARVNRLFVVGVLTEVESVTDEVLRARVVDPTGAFVVYAGQYQPEAMAFFDRASPPMFVAITGKANTFSPDDSDRVYTSIRPESVTEVDAETRDRWTVAAAEHTIGRVSAFAEAYDVLESAESPAEARRMLEAEGMETTRAAGLVLARDHYGTTPAYLASMRAAALDAARLVTGEVDEVERPSLAPDEGGSTDLDTLRAPDVSPAAPVQSAGDPGPVSEAGSAVDSTASGEAETTPTDSESPGSEGEPATEEPSTSETDPTSPTPEPEPARGTDSGSEGAVEGAATGTTESASQGVESERTEPVSATDAGDAPSTEPASPADEDAEPEPLESEPTADAEAETSPEPVPTEPTDAGDPTADTAAETGSAGEADATDDLEDFEPSGAEDVGMYEMSDEEREEVESEFGTEFETGGEVDDPGEADIEVPDPEPAEPEAETRAETGGEKPEGEDAGDDADGDGEPAVNVENEAMEAMRALSDGDGAEREAIVSRVSEEHGVSPDAVEDAITDALMSGRCYEPRDGVLKPI